MLNLVAITLIVSLYLEWSKMKKKKRVDPKKIKFLEKAINSVIHKKRPVRAEVIPETVPAWGSIKKGE